MTQDQEGVDRLAELLAKAVRQHAGQPSARKRLFALLLPKDREADGLLPVLVARLKAMEEALRPFAVRASGLEDFDDEDTVAFDPQIAVGHFRLARLALGEPK